MPRLLCAVLAATLALCCVPAAHALPASEIAGVAVHPWTMKTPAKVEQTFTEIEAAGVRWARVDLRWHLIEPREPSIRYGLGDWREMDAIVAAADRHGVQLLPIIGLVPGWASTEGDLWAYPHLTFFEEFFAEALRRYPQVQAWELWNEPNFERFSKPWPNPAAFVELLRSARRVRDGVRPSAKLIAGGLAPRADIDIFPWVDQIAQLGGLQLVDGLGIHPYSPLEADEPGSWMMRLEELDEHLAALGRPDLPLWLTEYGAPASSVPSGYGPPLTEEAQAQRLRKAFALASRLPFVENLTWFEYRDSCDDPADPECRFGLVRADMSPRPAYHALQDVIAGATAKLRPRLALKTSLRNAVAARASSARRMRRVAHVRPIRPKSGWVAVRGKLLLPGSADPTGQVHLRVLRPGRRPQTVSVRVVDGVFRTRLKRRDTSRWTIEAHYPGSSSYEPVTARVQLSGLERIAAVSTAGRRGR